MENDERMNEIAKAAGGYAFQKGVEHGVTAATGNPLVGKAAGYATKAAPDSAKTGAAIGAATGAYAAGVVMKTGAIALGVSVFAPAVLGLAVVGGIVGLLCSESKK